MAISACLEWHNCNNGWKAGGTPFPILATGHSVHYNCRHLIKSSQLSSCLPHAKIHPPSRAQHINAINVDNLIDIETEITAALILRRSVAHMYCNEGLLLQLLCCLPLKKVLIVH